MLALALLLPARTSLAGGLDAFHRGEALLRAGRVAEAATQFDMATQLGGLGPSERARLARHQRKLKWVLHDENYGALDVWVHPPEADCQLEGKPMPRLGGHCFTWVKAGSYALLVGAPQHDRREIIVTAARGERRSTKLVLASTAPPLVLVSTGKVSAEVWVDGRAKGPVTPAPLSVEAGYRLFEVRAKGFRPWVKGLQLANGQRVSLEVELDPEPLVTGPVRREIALSKERPLTSRELTGPEDPLGDGRRTPPPRLEVGKAERDPRDEVTGGAPPGHIDGQVDTAPAHKGRSLAGWLVGGGGLAAGGVGAWLLARAISDANAANALPLGSPLYGARYDDALRRGIAGYALIGAGVFATGAGAFLLLRGGDDGSGTAVSLVPAGPRAAGLSLVGRF